VVGFSWWCHFIIHLPARFTASLPVWLIASAGTGDVLRFISGIVAPTRAKIPDGVPPGSRGWPVGGSLRDAFVDVEKSPD
jgi:hypothetical protein